MLCRRIECWKMLVGHLVVLGCLVLMPPPSVSTALPPMPTTSPPPTTSSTHRSNNTCYKTETVEVQVAVPLQEPATFRSYTWCLKVPPRCSKYTVIMRERIVYQTEVRNHTVSECCPGHVSLYGECVPACLTCHNMVCHAGNCTCLPGFTGPNCNLTCDPGKWGARCEEACICRVGEYCDPVSGSCTLTTTTTTAPSPLTTLLYTTPVSTFTPTLTTSTVPTVRSPTKSSSTLPVMKNIPTTPNAFVNLTLTDPTTSTEDLTDFNLISKPQENNSVKTANPNNDENSLNALGDADYPVMPTDSGFEFNYIQEQEATRNIILNSVIVNGNNSVNAEWISELGAQSGVKLGLGLALFALVAVVVSAVVRCHNNKALSHQVSPLDSSGLHLVARNSHYAVPGPPSFSFINGYNLSFTKEIEDTYDHPRSVRCLVVNEPVYDELKY